MNYTLNKEKLLQKLKEMCILRGYSKQTIKSYIYNVSRFLDFIKKSRLNLTKSSAKSNYLITFEIK